MRTAVVLFHIVAIVSRYHFDARTLADLQHVGNDLALFLEPMIVELKKKSILAEDILVFRCGALCLIKTAHKDVGRDLAVKACRKSNQALAVFGPNCRMSGLYRVDLARVELQHGEFEQALADSRTALDNVGAHADKNSFRYADALSVRADALLATGHRQDAQRDLRVVVDTLKRTVGPKHALTIAASGKLALIELRTAARAPRPGLIGRD